VLQRLREARQNVRKNQDGFTLIELLIVIIILGVLAGIVVFAVRGITDRGDTSACKADVTSVQGAAEAYYAKNGSYAALMSDLVTAGYLHSVPNSTKYTITYSGPPTGQVTGKLANGTDCMATSTPTP
jgi:general secretion pathway protein G